MATTIVFDLDGTLVDSARDLAASTSELVEGLGGDALEMAEVIPMVGDGASLLVERALAHAGLDPKTPGALDRFLAIYDRRLLDHTWPYEGVPEVLAMLVHVGPLVVLTNKPTRATETMLEALGLRGFFSEVIGGDTSHGRKPDPAGLRHLLARTGGLGVMIGDSPVDAGTAEAAPSPFVLAGWGFGVGRFGAVVDRTKVRSLRTEGSGVDGTKVPSLRSERSTSMERQDFSPVGTDFSPVGWRIANHPRELVSLLETLTFDAARVPIVMR